MLRRGAPRLPSAIFFGCDVRNKHSCPAVSLFLFQFIFKKVSIVCIDIQIIMVLWMSEWMIRFVKNNEDYSHCPRKKNRLKLWKFWFWMMPRCTRDQATSITFLNQKNERLTKWLYHRNSFAGKNGVSETVDLFCVRHYLCICIFTERQVMIK